MRPKVGDSPATGKTSVTDPSAPPRLYLFVDTDCPLCVRLGRAVAAWDRSGRIAVVDLHGEGAEALLDEAQLAAARSELTVRDGLGNLCRGVEALRRIADLLPGIRRLRWAYQLPGVTPALDRVYRAVHRHRRALCLKCGETWMPSVLRRRRRGRRR